MFVSGSATCPLVNRNGYTFENAFNGFLSGPSVTSRGSDFGLVSSGTVQGASLFKYESDGVTRTFFSVELWIRPSFDSGSGDIVEFVLLELGKPKPAGTSYNWGCTGSGTDFDMKISYLPESNNFQLIMRNGVNYKTILSITTAVLTSGTDHHFVLAFDNIFSSQYLTAKMYLDNQDISGLAVDSISSSLATPNWQSLNTVYIGSDPSVYSSSISAADVFAFPGEIRLAGIYNKTMVASDVTANYQAGLMNSEPVAASTSVTIPVNEDELTELVDWKNAFYDDDNDTLTYYLVSGLEDLSTGNKFNGVLRSDSATVVQVGDQIDSVFYQQDAANAYKDTIIVPKLEPTAYSKDPSNSESRNATIEINDVISTNDAPISLTQNQTIPQSTHVKFLLSSQDPDCRNSGVDSVSSCPTFGIADFTFDTSSVTGFGKWYMSETDGTCNGYDNSTSVLLDGAV